VSGICASADTVETNRENAVTLAFFIALHLE